MENAVRDNQWLAKRLEQLHSTYFTDVRITNRLFVRFSSRPSRTRLGSIIARQVDGLTQPATYITVNTLLRDLQVPEYVIDATLLHEFTHYTHGFHSPHPKRYTHPHRGNIVNREIRSRGGGTILEQQLLWIRSEYPNFLRRQGLL